MNLTKEEAITILNAMTYIEHKEVMIPAERELRERIMETWPELQKHYPALKS